MSDKRFFRSIVCGDDGLYDKKDGCIITNVRSNIDLDKNWDIILDKLNELAEENEQLKSYIDTTFDVDKLAEENKLLKQRLKLLERCLCV